MKKIILSCLMGISLMTEISEARWHPILMKTPIRVFEKLGIERSIIIRGASLIFKAEEYERIGKIIEGMSIKEIGRKINDAIFNIEEAGKRIRKLDTSDKFWTHEKWDAILLYRNNYMGPITPKELPENIVKAYKGKYKKDAVDSDPHYQTFVSCHKKRICIDLAVRSGNLEVLRIISEIILTAENPDKTIIDDNFKLLEKLYLAKLYALCFHNNLGTITMVTSNTEQICQTIVSNKPYSIYELGCIIKYVQEGQEYTGKVLDGLYCCVKDARKYGVDEDEILSILLAIAFEFADTRLDLTQLLRGLNLEETDLNIDKCETFGSAFLRGEYEIYSDAFGIPYDTAKDLYPASYRPAANSVIPITTVMQNESVKDAIEIASSSVKKTRYSDCFESTIMHLLMAALCVPTSGQTRLCEASSFRDVIKNFLTEHPNYYSYPFCNDIFMRAAWARTLYSIVGDDGKYVLSAGGKKLELDASLNNLVLVLCRIAQINHRATAKMDVAAAVAYPLQALFGTLEGVRNVRVEVKESTYDDLFRKNPCYIIRVDVYRDHLKTSINLRIIENRHAEVESITFTPCEYEFATHEEV